MWNDERGEAIVSIIFRLAVIGVEWKTVDAQLCVEADANRAPCAFNVTRAHSVICDPLKWRMRTGEGKKIGRQALRRNLFAFQKLPAYPAAVTAGVPGRGGEERRLGDVERGGFHEARRGDK